jgi:N-acetylmuramic acid 6-phosphate etherase
VAESRTDRPPAEATLDALATEQRLPAAAALDQLDTRAQVALLAEQDAVAVAAVAAAGDAIAAAVERTVPRLRRGGRLIELGAGTSGRLSLLDAAECGPTFGVGDDRVVAVMAGGTGAARRAMEHGEDDGPAGVAALEDLDVGPEDVVIGTSASGRTPYVLAALRHARDVGAATVAVVSNPGSPLAEIADVAIEALTGPEVIAGSTRLKAGTAQKLVLNAVSTLTMVQLGHTFGDLMVDVRATNDKLRRRAERTVAQATGASAAQVTAALDDADGHAKTAVVALLADVAAGVARTALEEADGHVRVALGALGGGPFGGTASGGTASGGTAVGGAS